MLIVCIVRILVSFFGYWFSQYWFLLIFLAMQEHYKYEDRKVAILNREIAGGTASTGKSPSSSDPAAERLRKIEEEAAASKKLSQVSVALAVGIFGFMVLTRSK